MSLKAYKNQYNEQAINVIKHQIVKIKIIKWFDFLFFLFCPFRVQSKQQSNALLLTVQN
jgi:hypothetical protein